MAWITLTSGDLATAQNVNNNFNHIFGGHRLPRTSVGASFVVTDGAYNVGTTSALWDKLYCDNLDFDGSISSGETLYANQASIILSATASTIELTGLDGDSASQFYISAHFVTDTTTNICMIINGDSAANYGAQILAASAGGVWADRTVSSYFLVGESFGETDSSYSNLIIYTKTGFERTGNGVFAGGCESTTITSVFHSSVIWDNLVDTVTSIKFYLTDGSFDTNTSVVLWGRQ